MAQASAFGFSGWDPLGSFGESLMASYFNEKMLKRNAALQYQYAQRYAENTPTWSVKGLRNAGLNPILAVSNGVSFGGNTPSIPQTDDFQGSSLGFNGTVMRKIQQKQAQSNIETQESQKQLNDANASAALQNAKANTMQAQAAVAESNARIAQINQTVENIDKGGGYKTSVGQDFHRTLDGVYNGVKELWRDASSSDDKGPYLQNSPKDPVISLDEGKKVYMDADEVKKFGSKEEALKEFFRRVDDSHKKKKHKEDELRNANERKWYNLMNVLP